MLFSAVSLAIAMGAQQAQPATAVPPVWATIQPSVIELIDARGVNGVAALIHDSGLFLAHNSSVGGTVVRARFSDRSELSLLVVGIDEQTQLTLLKAMVWSSGVRRPIKVAPEPTKDGVELLAVTVGGPKIGEFIGGNKAGVMKPSLRYVPLSEVRMKSSNEHLGGSFVFNLNGELVGVLGAALADENSKASDAGTRVAAGGGGFGGGSNLRQFGESSVTVAYALGREVLQRVVKGFISPSHEVEHPTIGIFFKASTDGRGVLVDSVMASSPAGQAGIQPGDLILEVDGTAVNNPVDLAVMLFRKNVGDKITVRYGRGLLRGTANMTVAGTQELVFGR